MFFGPFFTFKIYFELLTVNIVTHTSSPLMWPSGSCYHCCCYDDKHSSWCILIFCFIFHRCLCRRSYCKLMHNTTDFLFYRFFFMSSFILIFFFVSFYSSSKWKAKEMGGCWCEFLLHWWGFFSKRWGKTGVGRVLKVGERKRKRNAITIIIHTGGVGGTGSGKWLKEKKKGEKKKKRQKEQCLNNIDKRGVC